MAKFGVGAAAMGVALGLIGLGGAQAQSPAKVETRAISGLKAPAELIVDHWGIPHIFAASARDAFFLQGYNAARDRLWQIDLWRKRGLGRLSASFGPAYVEEDRAARLLLYRGDMDAEWAAYAPGAKDEAEAFVAGINAYVDEVRAGRRPLPVEFRLTHSAPERWEARDVVRIRSNALVGNLTSEVLRARLVCQGGVAADSYRVKLEPAHALTVPEGLDPCAIPADVLKTYTLGVEPVAFSPKTLTVAALDLGALDAATTAEGSNNWTVAPSRTATGRPLVANDPHRALGGPSLRYVVQIAAPGLDLIGAGEPALPGVSFGHTPSAAFGLTIFPIDQEDLYVYDLNPADPDAYRYRDGWERMRVIRETIEVKGEPAREVELRFTRHGPVIDEDLAHHHAFAIRSVWQEPGTSAYMQATWLNHARDWTDFMAAHDHWGGPPLNLVWGDVSGVIGWAGSGKTPRRPNWDGLLPVPGDGRYEWAGFLTGAELPSLKNPAKGWFATANAYNLPADYPAETRKVGFEWADRSRIDRIDAVLGADRKVSVADSEALQTDVDNEISRRLTALIAPLTSSDPRLARALAALKAWNHRETTDSVATTIYEVWTSRHLGQEVVQASTPAGAWPLIGQGGLDAILTHLEHPGPELGRDPVAARDRLLLSSLSASLDDIASRLGPDMASWTWGRLHQARFVPAIAALAGPDLAARLSQGPTPEPGGPNTPRAAGYDRETFEVTHGASVRMVMDVGAWDRAVVVNSPGESADPSDPHFADLFPLWAKGAYTPLLYSRAAVEAAADVKMELTPGP
jgi:penicillin amidase